MTLWVSCVTKLIMITKVHLHSHTFVTNIWGFIVILFIAMKKAPTLSGSVMFSAVQMISSLLIVVTVDSVMLYVVTVKMLLSPAYSVSYNTVSLMLGNKINAQYQVLQKHS